MSLYTLVACSDGVSTATIAIYAPGTSRTYEDMQLHDGYDRLLRHSSTNEGAETVVFTYEGDFNHPVKRQRGEHTHEYRLDSEGRPVTAMSSSGWPPRQTWRYDGGTTVSIQYNLGEPYRQTEIIRDEDRRVLREGGGYYLEGEYVEDGFKVWTWEGNHGVGLSGWGGRSERVVDDDGHVLFESDEDVGYSLVTTRLYEDGLLVEEQRTKVVDDKVWTEETRTLTYHRGTLEFIEGEGYERRVGDWTWTEEWDTHLAEPFTVIRSR